MTTQTKTQLRIVAKETIKQLMTLGAPKFRMNLGLEKMNDFIEEHKFLLEPKVE